MSRSSATVAGERTEQEAAMRSLRLTAILMILTWASAATAWAEPGFDEKYQRDFNIFNPINQYQPANPLNPINAYDPANPFNPINQYDPNNPANPINRFNPNNPFNPINRYRPENPQKEGNAS